MRLCHYGNDRKKFEAVSILLLLANFAGDITLPIDVIRHEGSTVLVTLSGLRLLKR